MTFQPETFLGELSSGQTPIAGLTPPACPGIYAIYLRPDSSGLSFCTAGPEPVYLGISEDLAQRGPDNHFRSGQTGFSTLRRSIGALLLDQLRLVPCPRATGWATTNFRNYRFDHQGERRLSEWMETNLLVAARPIRDPERVEGRLVNFTHPPLNLKGWKNPNADRIRAARNLCVELAMDQSPQSRAA